MPQTILTVSAVNHRIKSWMDNDPELSRLYVRGEISNYRRYPSGHHYFSLKDEQSVLRCVLFAREAAQLKFLPQDGMSVIATGRVSVFPRDGAYQLYCQSLSPEGAGALAIAYEQLKNRLAAEGLFDPKHKKALPLFPKTIALITSPAGAVVRDMIRIMGRRWPLTEILVVPVRVQGEEAPGEIVQALSYVNRHKLADVIIVGRGGGSIEDLWAFNDERVARAIFASDIPVVSAVGHEPDVTMADFVADVRASTPSHAAETVVPDSRDWKATLKRVEGRLSTAMVGVFRRKKDSLRSYAEKKILQSPLQYFQDKKMLLDLQYRRFAAASERILHEKRRGFIALSSKLETLSPLAVLSRGYSLALKPDGTPVKTAADLRVGDSMTVTFGAGAARCSVDEVLP